MIPYPASAWQKVGFDAVRRAVRDEIRSEAGEGVFDAWSAFRSVDAVRAEMRRVAELQAVLESDERIPFESTPDVTDALRRAAPRDAMLAVEDLLDVARLIQVAAQVRAWFAGAPNRCPNVREDLLELDVPAALVGTIGQAIGDDGSVLDTASPELGRIRRALLNTRNQVRESALRALRAAIAAGWATEEQPTLRAGRMVIPVRAEARRKVQGFVHDVSATGQTVYVEPAASLDLNNDVRALELEEVREVERIRRHLTDAVRTHRHALAAAVQIMARLDLWLAKARVAHRMDASMPDVGTDGRVDVKGGRSASLVLHFETEGKGRPVVPFNLRMGPDCAMIVISGPNAGGKSVAMKAVGLMAAMVAHGLLLPVHPGSRFDLFDALMVDIGDEQSLEDDLSTFSSHLTNLTHILAESTPSTLVLIDEAGTGTDPEAGGAIAQAVLEALVDRGARTVVTTHFGPLKVFAHDREGVENASMMFDQARLAPTYRLEVGLPGSSFAAEIADRVGLPASIIHRARELMGDGRLRADALIAELVSKVAAAERHERETARAYREVEEQRRKLEERLSSVREEAEVMRTQALAEAEGIVKGANRLVERTIREIRESQAAREQTEAARSRLVEARENVQSRIKGQAGKQKKQTSGRRVADVGRPGTGTLSIGDQVRIDGGEAVGEVLSMSGKEVVVALGSMHVRAKPDRLTKVGGKKKQEVRVRQVGTTAGGASIQDVSTRLDIRGFRVDEAAAAVVPFLDRALAAGLDRVDILHGKGTGALRLAVAELLDATPHVADHHEAPLDEGGAGVTVVRLA
ncbi:MAG: Smr/MutS family protein [Rhodothermales bacterium]